MLCKASNISLLAVRAVTSLRDVHGRTALDIAKTEIPAYLEEREVNCSATQWEEIRKRIQMDRRSSLDCALCSGAGGCRSPICSVPQTFKGHRSISSSAAALQRLTVHCSRRIAFCLICPVPPAVRHQRLQPPRRLIRVPLMRH